MEINEEWLNSVGSISYFLAAFPALWISRRILLRNYSGDHRIARIFLWLALSGLFLTPIADALRYINSVLSLIIPSLWSSANITVFLGMGPFKVHSGISTILGILVYGLGYYYLRMLVGREKVPMFQEFQVKSWESDLVLLGVAGLANHMISGLVIGFVSIYLPGLYADQDFAQLLTGFWTSWLLAFLVFFATLWILNTVIRKGG